jgi:hypothetical protein
MPTTFYQTRNMVLDTSDLVNHNSSSPYRILKMGTAYSYYVPILFMSCYVISTTDMRDLLPWCEHIRVLSWLYNGTFLPAGRWRENIFLHAHLQVVYYKCVKFHKIPISGLGGVALTRYMDGRTRWFLMVLNSENLNTSIGNIISR